METIGDPKCRFCGRPFEFAIPRPGGKGLVCDACLKSKPKYDMCAPAVKYNAASKAIVLPLKHGDATGLAKFAAKMMTRSSSALLSETDAIIPVPIHARRMLKRKYNQAALVAGFMGKRSGKPVLYGAVSRVRATPSQGHLSFKERAANVHGAFRINSASDVRGRKILLVDDVMTSGATLNECARVLKEAGARRVYAAVFARA
jgi:ComF family protein